EVETPIVPDVSGGIFESLNRPFPEQASDLLEIYLESTRQLGERTAELHVVLASDSENKDFAPEPFTPFYQRSLYQSMRNLCVQTTQLLKRRIKTLPVELVPDAEKVLSRSDDMVKKFRAVADQPIRA